MAELIRVKIRNRMHTVELRDREAIVDGSTVSWDEIQIDATGGLDIRTGNRVIHAVIDFKLRENFVSVAGREFSFEIETDHDRLIKRFESARDNSKGMITIHASMPGMVMRVNSSIGEKIQKGQPLLILEAMKMENEIRSPADGTIREIRVVHGQPVEKGDLLMRLET